MKSEKLLEKLADLEHQQWANWANSILESEKISPERFQRWRKLIATPYAELSEEMKEHDRKWAKKVMQLIP